MRRFTLTRELPGSTNNTVCLDGQNPGPLPPDSFVDENNRIACSAPRTPQFPSGDNKHSAETAPG